MLPELKQGTMLPPKSAVNVWPSEIALSTPALKKGEFTTTGDDNDGGETTAGTPVHWRLVTSEVCELITALNERSFPTAIEQP